MVPLGVFVRPARIEAMTADPLDRLAALGPPLEPATIRAARFAVPVVFRDTPQYVSETLSTVAGVPVIVKVESVNPIGAFKGRGTWLAVRHLVETGGVGESRALVVASSGNFGQGCAWAGRAHGIPVVVFADDHANPRKLERIRAFGAEVIQAGEDFDEARVACAAYATTHGATLLVDGEEPWVATGAAGLAVELTDAAASRDLPDLGTAFVPVGNGALIVGVGAWLRHAAPACRVVGVQSEQAPSMTLSWREDRPVETERADTWAAGIASRVPVPEALDAMRGRVDDMVLVSDADLRTAQAELTAALGITVEGGGAASWAAVRAARDMLDGPVLVLVTGANAEQV
jgi:threonine dehydratase